jgi:hypothetical protein
MNKIKLYTTKAADALYIQHPNGYVECTYDGIADGVLDYIESGISPSQSRLDRLTKCKYWPGRLIYVGEL